jgi:hypothetical protein
MHQAHDGKPAKYTSVEEIAAHYLSEVRAVRPNGPYLLGGYCFGGVVAFWKWRSSSESSGSRGPACSALTPPVSLPRGCAGSPDTATRQSQGPRLRERLPHHRQPSHASTRDSESRMRWVSSIVERLTSGESRAPLASASSGLSDLGWELPVRLRSPHVLDLYRRALTASTVRVSGRTAVFVEVDEEAVEPHVKALAEGAYFTLCPQSTWRSWRSRTSGRGLNRSARALLDVSPTVVPRIRRPRSSRANWLGLQLPRRSVPCPPARSVPNRGGSWGRGLGRFDALGWSS